MVLRLLRSDLILYFHCSQCSSAQHKSKLVDVLARENMGTSPPSTSHMPPLPKSSRLPGRISVFVPPLSFSILGSFHIVSLSSSSEVRLARFVDSQILAAVKVIDLEVGTRMFRRELESFPRLRHPNLPRYLSLRCLRSFAFLFIPLEKLFPRLCE